VNFNILDILNNATNIEARVEGYTEIILDYDKIKVTKYNKYSMGELEEMAAGIEIAGGLQQPCLIGRVNERSSMYLQRYDGIRISYKFINWKYI